MGAEFAYFLNRENAPRLRVFVDGGEVIAHCGYRLSDGIVFGAKLRVGCVGAVCTHPDRRGAGLGTRLFLDAVDSMRAEGADLVLISGGRGLYTRNGAVGAADRRYFTFKLEAAGDWKSDAEVGPPCPADGSVLAALYRREPVRFLRPPSEWADILAGRWCMNRPARLLVVRRRGQLVAYAAVRAPKGADHEPEGTFLGEYAGCRHALACALPRLAELGESPDIRLAVPEWDSPLAAELTARGLRGLALSGHRTVKLVNFPQLLDRLRDLMVERAGPRAARLAAAAGNGKVSISLDAERLELSEVQACRMVFGGESGPDREMLQGRGELGKVLGAALPVEMPWYGYNYV
jgi:GNAT superfamily N-acetyltransferase